MDALNTTMMVDRPDGPEQRRSKIVPAARWVSIDYRSIVANAVAGLASNTPDARRDVYAQARGVVHRHLQLMRLPEPIVELEKLALDLTIRKVERQTRSAQAIPEDEADEPAEATRAHGRRCRALVRLGRRRTGSGIHLADDRARLAAGLLCPVDCRCPAAIHRPRRVFPGRARRRPADRRDAGHNGLSARYRHRLSERRDRTGGAIPRARRRLVERTVAGARGEGRGAGRRPHRTAGGNRAGPRRAGAGARHCVVARPQRGLRPGLRSQCGRGAHPAARTRGSDRRGFVADRKDPNKLPKWFASYANVSEAAPTSSAALDVAPAGPLRPPAAPTCGPPQNRRRRRTTWPPPIPWRRSRTIRR